MVNLYILLLYIYLVYALSYFFMKKMQIMCNWCCPCEEKMFCFYSLLVMYIHCGLLKGYTAYSIFKIPLLIILVLNHWFKFFFQNNTYVILVFFFEAEAKNIPFQTFFYIGDLFSKLFFLETWPSTLNSVVTFHSIWSCLL